LEYAEIVKFFDREEYAGFVKIMDLVRGICKNNGRGKRSDARRWIWASKPVTSFSSSICSSKFLLPLPPPFPYKWTIIFISFCSQLFQILPEKVPSNLT